MHTIPVRLFLVAIMFFSLWASLPEKIYFDDQDPLLAGPMTLDNIKYIVIQYVAANTSSLIIHEEGWWNDWKWSYCLKVILTGSVNNHISLPDFFTSI